eukprot:801083-Prymnesium_polylepis.1
MGHRTTSNAARRHEGYRRRDQSEAREQQPEHVQGKCDRPQAEHERCVDTTRTVRKFGNFIDTT